MNTDCLDEKLSDAQKSIKSLQNLRNELKKAVNHNKKIKQIYANVKFVEWLKQFVNL